MNGDWNCDGVVERQHGVNVDCEDHSLTSAACGSIHGFTGEPACGTAGQWVTCIYPGVGPKCSSGTIETRTQGCR